jgi:hypothetical protein
VHFSVGGAFLNAKSMASHQYFQQGLLLILEFKLHDVERTNFYVVYIFLLELQLSLVYILCPQFHIESKHIRN